MIKVVFKNLNSSAKYDTWAEALCAAEDNIMTEMANCHPNTCESEANKYNLLDNDLRDIRYMKWYIRNCDNEPFFCINGHTVSIVDIDLPEYKEYQEKHGISIEYEPYDDYDDGYEDNGYTDEVGGYHDGGIGYNPHGLWCGECTKGTCKGCPNENFKDREEWMRANEQVWLVTCTEWDEPEVHRTYQGAYDTLIEDIKSLYEYEGDDPSELIAEVKRQYDAGYKTISVEDCLSSYRVFPVSFMD